MEWEKYAITVTYLIFSLAESSRFDPYLVFLVLYTEFYLTLRYWLQYIRKDFETHDVSHTLSGLPNLPVS